MGRAFDVEDDHVDDILEHLEKLEGLEHLRARRRAEVLTLESGPKNDPIAHVRFRRVGVHKWQLEMPTHGERWLPTPYRDQLLALVDVILKEFAWTLESHDAPTRKRTR